MDSIRIVYFNHSNIVSLEKAELGIQLGEGGGVLELCCLQMIL